MRYIVKYKSVFFIFFILSFVKLQAQMQIKGIRKNENLYILNPALPDTTDFCIDSIYINNHKIKTETASSAFELDFEMLGITKNELLEIVIYHKKNCLPKIINPDVVKPQSTYQPVSMELKNDTLYWTTKNEHGKLMFFVEQYRWKKWQPAGQILGHGTPDLQHYKIKVNLHSGTNKFRIKQVDYTGRANLSSELIYESLLPKVEFSPGDGKKVSRIIEFSAKTDYEVYDYFGELIFFGCANKIDVSDLESGTYFIKYDNTIAKFIRR